MCACVHTFFIRVYHLALKKVKRKMWSGYLKVEKFKRRKHAGTQLQRILYIREQFVRSYKEAGILWRARLRSLCNTYARSRTEIDLSSCFSLALSPSPPLPPFRPLPPPSFSRPLPPAPAPLRPSVSSSLPPFRACTPSLPLSFISHRCTCAPGFTGAPCAPCAAGKYKSATGTVLFEPSLYFCLFVV